MFRSVLKKNTSEHFLYYPIFNTSEELIDQVYRLTWYLPKRKNYNIEMYYNFEIQKDFLSNEKNRPWYLHSLPINLKNIKIIKSKFLYSFRLIKYLLIGDVLVFAWKETNSTIYKFVKLLCDVRVMDHTNLSYFSDVSYSELMNYLLNEEEGTKILKESQQIFIKEITLLKQRFNKTYIFGRGPSLGATYKYNYESGARIISNQIVKDKSLMSHIKPHILVACDHAWHFGCSKVADCYRKDLVEYVKNNNVIYVVPINIYPLLIFHYPELKTKLVGLPFKGKRYNFDLISGFYSKASYGVLFEFLFPIASSISKQIYMLGIDGKVPKSEAGVVYPYSNTTTYKKEIVDSIYASRPGYYECMDMSLFENKFALELKEMVFEAESQGYDIKVLEKSYHEALADKHIK